MQGGISRLRDHHLTACFWVVSCQPKFPWIYHRNVSKPSLSMVFICDSDKDKYIYILIKLVDCKDNIKEKKYRIQNGDRGLNK